MNRTEQAFRQALVAALTGLTYQINNGTPQTLSNLKPAALWDPGNAQAAMPLVCYTVERTGFTTRHLPESNLALTLSVISSTGPDEVTEISEAIVNRLHTADQQSEGPADLSRPVQSGLLGIVVRKCELARGGKCMFDAQTQRWYRTLEFSITAN